MRPTVDRRTEQRDKCHETRTITVLNSPVTPLLCTVINESDGGLNVSLLASLSPGTLLEVEGHDHILLGEVIWSRPIGESFAMGIKVVHSIGNLSALARLNRELIKYSEPGGSPVQSLETERP